MSGKSLTASGSERSLQAHIPVRLRKHRRRPGAHRRRLGGRFGASAARRQPPEDVAQARRSRGNPLEMQRPPDAVPLRKSVAARHHADDRDGRAADADDAADGVCRAGQLVLPEVVSDHHDLVRAAPFVGVEQRASHQRWHAREREGRRGDAGDGLRLTGTGADGDAALVHLDGAEVGDRAEAVAPQLVIAPRRGDPRVVGDVPAPQRDDRVAVRERNRRPERLPRDLEPDGADGDRERDRNRCDRGERRVLDQHATGEPEVEPRDAKTVERARSHEETGGVPVLELVAPLSKRSARYARSSPFVSRRPRRLPGVRPLGAARRARSHSANASSSRTPSLARTRTRPRVAADHRRRRRRDSADGRARTRSGFRC